MRAGNGSSLNAMQRKESMTRFHPSFLLRAILLTAGLAFFLSGLQAQTVTDIDGNVYPVVTIGTQVWMAENLKTTRYRDGLGIPLVTDSSTWRNSRLPGFCWYANTTLYKDIFGALYNWFAVSSGKLAPEGWHVPSDAEWKVLTDFLGGEAVAGGKLKSVGTIEVGTSYWYTPNTGASNLSGFSAIAGGAREFDGAFNYRYSFGFWWTASGDNSETACYRQLSYNYPDVQRGFINIQDGLSVRCVKDTEPGIEKNDPGEFLKIYPVPANDYVFVECARKQSLEISVLSLAGSVLIQATREHNTNTVNLSSLPKGMYVVRVEGPGWQVHKILIKE